MAEKLTFPKTFVEYGTPVQHLGEMDATTEVALRKLSKQGLHVCLGMERRDVPQVAVIARQKGTREFYPKDEKKRWGNEEMAEAQLAKNGGRAAFMLKDGGDVIGLRLDGP